jgi:kynurenine formamidase
MFFLRALAFVVALASCEIALAAPPSQPQPVLDLARLRIVDLTHTFDAQTVYWPNAPSTFTLTRLHYGMSDGGFFYSANSFCTPEHGGTHLDAPIHFAEGHRTVDDVPLEQLIGPAVVIDVSGKAEKDADYRLSRADAEAWEIQHGRIAAKSIVLLRTGWSKRWPDRKRYMGDDTPGDATNLHFPSFGVDAVQLLVGERSVAALGVDTASIDYGPSQDFRVHQIASAANVPGLENLADLDQLPEIGAWIIALPMKIGGGSGGPLRIVALVPR